MSIFYEKTLRNIVYLCKFVGIINISYVLQSDGLLIENTESFMVSHDRIKNIRITNANGIKVINFGLQ
ncbi:hypothetical protein FWK35_00025425 [Aphis craccivora]|uniref:Uncharacterized protein n=1 Tax=Aphis craccivora TaxID=307492 RepID=A0A6G0W0Z2_APHCR|nr:hypothetical protein FWK35_00025425 [Aphis craccivora]